MADINMPLRIHAGVLLLVFIINTILLNMVFIASEAEAKEKDSLPFSIGEILSYSIRWEMVPAGEAEFRIRPKKSIKDREAWHFSLTVKSNRYVDVLHKIRDRLDGYTDKNFIHSLFYKRIQSGKEKKRVKVFFDWEKKTAIYSNSGRRQPAIDIPPNTFDPLSAFYKMRTTQLSPGQVLSFPITDGKKQFMQTAQVVEKQTININGKDVETFLIIPSINHFSGVFKKSENPTVRVWVSADDKKIPVLIKIKVFIGSVIFSLENSN